MPARPRRRAVGPAGASPPQPGSVPAEEPPDRAQDSSWNSERADDERLLADRPPHHDRGV